MKSLIVLLVAGLGLAAAANFANYTVYRVQPTTELQLEFLFRLQDEFNIDFWREPAAADPTTDLMLSPADKLRFLPLLRELGLTPEIFVPDVERRIRSEQLEQVRAQMQTYSTRADEAISGFWTSYKRYADHSSLIDAIVSQNPTIAARVNFGTSYEKRTLSALVLGTKTANKPVIWLECGIHAREWISPATCTYFAQQLVNKYNANDADAKDLLSFFDFYIVPVLNADGYEYTHTTSRLWRKTRQPNSGSTCAGTDPNRNFGYQWGGKGTSANPCSEIYKGASAFSEPETKAESDYILNQLKGRVKALLAVHSYGQYFLYPWGYTPTVTKDDAELKRVATIAVAALNQVTPATKYAIGTSTNVLSEGAGGTDDWSYGSAGVTYSYTVELRDKGTYGFQLPASQIVATGTETTAAFIALAKEVKKKV